MKIVEKSEQHPAEIAPVHMPFSLLSTHPEAWAQYPHEKLFTLGRGVVEPLQLAALSHRFEQLKDSIPALERLATRQNVKCVESIGEALPLFLDHRVYKSYPISLIETRDFPKLTSWLNRLTLHNLSRMNLGGLTTIDNWLDRLDEYGMMVGHSTGTTGKLSFIPRSSVEWPAWKASFNDTTRAASGVDPTRDFLPTFFPGYRGGHQMALKMLSLFHIPAAGGAENYHTLYQTPMSSDLMSLAGRLQSAEDKGELDRLGLDPALLQKREEMIAQGRRRGQDMEVWFTKMIEQYRGKRVKVGGSFADLTRVAIAGKAKGLKCAFAEGSIISSGGGMKGFKDAPENWRELIKEFFGIQRISGVYGMSESIGQAPLCSSGFHHFLPYTLPILLDRDATELPRTGTRTGRLALFDMLAETYWGGFVSGDQVTMHWDEDCPCGWKGPRIARDITRFAEMEGGDDKITCAGSTEAYNEFMDYVSQV